MGLVIALSLWFLGWPGILSFLSIIPSVILIFLFGWSISSIFGLATVYFRDTKHLSEVGLQILFYITPVMYPPSVLEGRRIGILLKFNPLSPFLELIRDPLIYQKLPSIETFGVATVLTLSAMVVAYSALKASEKRIIFHL
jgi:ABC-type polysaccharide/polyol phosphate export permease